MIAVACVHHGVLFELTVLDTEIEDFGQSELCGERTFAPPQRARVQPEKQSGGICGSNLSCIYIE